jgi:hypothetical protein
MLAGIGQAVEPGVSDKAGTRNRQNKDWSRKALHVQPSDPPQRLFGAATAAHRRWWRACLTPEVASGAAD